MIAVLQPILTSNKGAFSCVGTTSIAYATMHKWPGMARARFEKSRGTCQQNIDYCFKGDLSHNDYMTGGKRNHPLWGRNAVTFFKGTPPEPGKAHKLRDAANMIISGHKVQDLARTEEFASTCAQYTRGLLFIEACNVPCRIGPPQVYWFYGKTGLGKTRCAVEFGKLDGSYWKSGGNSTVGSGVRWFDGYNGQRVAIIDDFRAKGVRFDFILQLLDRYEFRVEYKTGSVNWVPQYIFVTTPKSIKDTFQYRFKHIPEDIGQLRRRVTRSFKFGNGVGEWTFETALKELQKATDEAKDLTSSSEEQLSAHEYYKVVGGEDDSTQPCSFPDSDLDDMEDMDPDSAIYKDDWTDNVWRKFANDQEKEKDFEKNKYDYDSELDSEEAASLMVDMPNNSFEKWRDSLHALPIPSTAEHDEGELEKEFDAMQRHIFDENLKKK